MKSNLLIGTTYLFVGGRWRQDGTFKAVEKNDILVYLGKNIESKQHMFLHSAHGILNCRELEDEEWQQFFALIS